MPPQTRRCKTTKDVKENIDVISQIKNKNFGKASKQRKALADKTNSASDDNLSTEFTKEVKLVTDKGKETILDVQTRTLRGRKNLGKGSKPRKALSDSTYSASGNNLSTEVSNKIKVVIEKGKEAISEVQARPRRERKLPNRYNESKVLINLSSLDKTDQHDSSKDSEKIASPFVSPFKTPQRHINNSLITNRPKRICRLPSKFSDHSVSPNKFIPVGCNASTPIIQNKMLNVEMDVVATNTLTGKAITQKVTNQNKINLKKNIKKKKSEISTHNISPDTNNNAKKRQLREKKVVNKNEVPFSSQKEVSTDKKATGKRLLQNNYSFKVLEDKTKPTKRDNSHLDVYEFTYDPNEEPPPQKKKRKRTVKKKQIKPKIVTFKNNYDYNVSKALVALKNAVKKPIDSQIDKPLVVENKNDQQQTVSTANILLTPAITTTSSAFKVPTEIFVPEDTPQKPVNNTRVEDVAADFGPHMEHNDINYSPVTSPNHGKSSALNDDTLQQSMNHDPLNLQDNLSFFDDIPVASSSMNTSVRRPHASPWRVEFQQLPIKWQVNTCIKPNMTPAVESSFINFNSSNKKKHVYTNLVPESDEVLPEIVSKDKPNLTQTSIISYIKEVVEKSASKKQRALSVTPTKANSVFEDFSPMSTATNRDMYNTPNKTPSREASNKTPSNQASNNNGTQNKIQENVVNTDKENSKDSTKSKRKTQTPNSAHKHKDGTFFGFDDSEDQENVSPVKIDNPRVRALRPRARAVLQEINAESGPTRAKIPIAAKTNIVASSDAVNKIYEGIKSATDAPVFPKNNIKNDNTNVNIDNQPSLQDEDSQSVHLFEDIELIHHLKPLRKSYGKAKKVAFQQTVASDSDSQSLDAPPRVDDGESSEEDDLADLTFTMPNVVKKNDTKKKTTKKKKQLSKKEKAAMEAWAAQFNSMCEDVEEFPLVVE
ncbi:unnamed protein product [Diatraea saccharalis]|uniref:Uncharacterized protein n=1 Tax=Diatraea saccharalis TaxID=40085 RepID=A0A9N9R4B1_9NEOP|nr:unnamed protein product [Diatraea saccharalis]